MSNVKVIDWIEGEIHAGRHVLVPVKLYDSVIKLLTDRGINAALRDRVHAKDVTQKEVENLKDNSPEA